MKLVVLTFARTERSVNCRTSCCHYGSSIRAVHEHSVFCYSSVSAQSL